MVSAMKSAGPLIRLAAAAAAAVLPQAATAGRAVASAEMCQGPS